MHGDPSSMVDSYSMSMGKQAGHLQGRETRNQQGSHFPDVEPGKLRSGSE